MRVQIWMPTLRGYRRNGTLRSVTADSISLQTDDKQVLTLPLSELDGISVSLGRSAARGAVRGLWIGGAVGLLVGPLAGNDGGHEESQSITSVARPENVAIGAAAGALLGAIQGREVWRRVAVATPQELAWVKRTALSGAVLTPFAATARRSGSRALAAGMSVRF